MQPFTRRAFLKTGAAGAVLGANRALRPALAAADKEPAREPVHFLHDGLGLSPREYTQLLVQLEPKSDMYLAGGAVAELETRFAQMLGKERAVFIATGTLANHLAIRRLARTRSRVLVQAESHIYNDAFDCVQTLSHLNLVSLASGQATFTLDQVEEACKRAAGPPYPVPVGALAIESPVRRRGGEAFDFEELKRIAAFARKHDIQMHLDGARLFVAPAYTGIGVADYAALFDTVYVSLYKYFNAGAGAILAGRRELIEQVARDRKVFGAGLFQGWPYAAVALHYLDGFLDRFRKAVAVSRALYAELAQHSRFRIEPVPHGTNISKLRVHDVNAAKYRAALEKRGVHVRPTALDPKTATMGLTVNESLNRRSAAELARSFIEALADA